jgi:puromycin-sensitive aminopeptidase
MFDVLTYEKGSSVLRMLELYLGEEAFRTGISTYLRRHAFSNTENADLWAALEEASGEPVGEIMDTWILQGGYPAVDVESGEGSITLSQRQFRLIGDGDATWKVPILYRSEAGDGRILLGDEQVTVEVGDDVVVNAGGEGFYRVAYDEGLFGSIVDRLPDLDPIERFSVVSDASAEMLAGGIDAAEYLDLVERLVDEPEIDVWMAALSGIDELDRVISSDDRDALRAFVRNLLGPKADQLGWQPDDGESDRTRALRGLLLRSLGNLGEDREVIETAKRIDESPGDICVEVVDAASSIVASHGDLDEFEMFLERSRSADTPQRKVKYLRLAAQVPHEEVPRRLFDQVLSGEVRSQDSFWLLAVLLGHRENGPRTWELVTEHWDDLMGVLAPNHRYRILDLIKYRSEPDVAAAIQEWFSTHSMPGSEKVIAQRMEMLEVRVGLREREGERLGARLA